MTIQADKTPTERESSGDRLLAVLALFSVERPQWTVEDASVELGVSPATSYRYFKRLTSAGLITPVAGAGYALGPAIIQMDRLIQISDPMLRAGRGVMQSLIGQVAERSTLLLCRLFHDRVICVHQIAGRGPQDPVSYERGRPMPLFLGATSKIILAHLPSRALKAVFEAHPSEIAAAGLGADWESFRSTLATMRRAGVAVSRGDIDPGRIGIGVPVFDRDRVILGSLSLALSANGADEQEVEWLKPVLTAGAREIERLMNDEPVQQAAPARLRVAR